MHILISFDPGVSLGYAVWEVEKYRSAEIVGALLQHGCSTVRKGKESGGTPKRIANLCGHLVDLHGHHGLTIIAEEQFYYPGMPAFLMKSIAACQEILGQLKAHFAEFPFETVRPGEWQGALLSGMGSTVLVDGKPRKYDTKAKSLYRCEQLLGRGFSDHNETDAILIGIHHLDHQKFAERIKEAKANA